MVRTSYGAYSSFKIIHHQDRLEDFRQGRQPVPLQVEFVISDICNQNCSFCAYRMDGYTSNILFGKPDLITGISNNNPNRKIPFEKCSEILSDLQEMGVKAVQFTGGGEPTSHPQHIEIFRKTLDLGLDFALISNGTIVKDALPELLSHGKWVRFSIDAGNTTTYSRIREVPSGTFDKVLANVRKVVDARMKNRDSGLIIGTGFIVTKDNYKEIYEATKIYKDLGVDNIRIGAAFTSDNYAYHQDHYEEARELASRAKEDFHSNDFSVFNQFGDRIQDLLDRRIEDDFCGYMYLNAYIGADLNIYTCCNNAYSPDGKMGSIDGRRLKDFWFSPEKQQIYANFKATRCARCMFIEKNRLIAYALNKNPIHVNYI
ncbi:MAG: Elp3 protein [Magnetococcales bacterium]|nr:Elp3 protein [Magnetococcales bacterium]